MVLENIEINEHNVGCIISIPAPSKVINKHDQCYFDIVSWPKICLEWIQIIHLLQNLRQLLLNYFPFDHKGKSRMKGSSDGLLQRDHTTASFKARGTFFKKLNHNPIRGHFLGCLDHPEGAWIEQIDSQSHSSEDHIHVIRIYRIKLAPDNIIGLMSQATHVYLLRLPRLFFVRKHDYSTPLLYRCSSYLSVSPIYKCNKG